MSFLSKSEIQEFRQWLKLDEKALTWQGRYKEELDEFWGQFFLASSEIYATAQRFRACFELLAPGPARSWMEWLQERFILYCFIRKGVSIEDLARWFGRPVKEILFLLHSHFLQTHPDIKNRINDLFQVQFFSDEKKFWTFQILTKNFQLKEDLAAYSHYDMRQAYEVTLNKDWKQIMNSFMENKDDIKIHLQKSPGRKAVRGTLTFFKDAVLIMVITVASVLLLEQFNRVYELHLLDKIKIFEPNFFWLDRSLSFKFREEASLDLNLSSDEIEELEKQEQTLIDEWEVATYEADPEVILHSSTDGLFSQAETSLSAYEEKAKQVIRDRGYGYNKAYRILLNSPDPSHLKLKINDILASLETRQVDSVKPGTEIPGGVYYNIFVSSEQIEQLVEQVSGFDDSNVYINKTNLINPKGFERVFIWIKSI